MQLNLKTNYVSTMRLVPWSGVQKARLFYCLVFEPKQSCGEDGKSLLVETGSEHASFRNAESSGILHCRTQQYTASISFSAEMQPEIFDARVPPSWEICSKL